MKRYQPIELKNAQGQLTVPFELSLSSTNLQSPQRPAPLTHEHSTWVCGAILRWLPGKRLVLQVNQGQQQSLAKIFFTRKDLKRELRGHQLLSRQGITTAPLQAHYADDAKGNTIDIIFYQWLDALTLEQLDAIDPLHADAPALQRCIAAVASMHRQGLRQVDIHPGNFLFNGDTLWVVDSAAVSSHRQPLRTRLARENLADLLAQFYPAQIDNLDGIWLSYCQQWPQPNWQLTDLPKSITKMRALRWRHYQRKLTRSCSEFQYQHNSKRLQVWRRDHDDHAMRSALAKPDSTMEHGLLLKRGNTATVAGVTVAGAQVIIKRYNMKNWRHRLNRCWRPSRAWHSWHNAHFLRFNGIPTPQPIALIEERQGPLRGRAFFFCEQVTGIDLKTYLVAANTADRVSMLTTLGGIIGQYQNARISHGDMKADNFIVSASGLTVIDLDPMTHHRHAKALNKALSKDIKRFINNFDGNLRNAIAQELANHLPTALVKASKA